MKVTSSPKNDNSRPRGYIEDYRPQRKTVELLDDVKAVLSEYQSYWPLSVRQIFYRLVGAFDYPKTERFYGTLGQVRALRLPRFEIGAGDRWARHKSERG